MATGDYTGINFSIPQDGVTCGICYDKDTDTYWANGYQYRTLYKYNKDGTYAGTGIVTGQEARGVTCVDGFLYSLDRYGTVKKFPTSGGGSVKSFSVSISTPTGITYDGTHLWVTGASSSATYAMQYTLDGVSTGVSMDLSEAGTGGFYDLTFDGVNFWVIHKGSLRAHKFNREGVYQNYSFEIQSPATNIGIDYDGTHLVTTNFSKVFKYEHISEAYVFDGDFTTISQYDFENPVESNIKLSADSSVLLSEGVGLQVTGIAYYPATQFRIGDTCTILDANNNVLFEHTGECYAVIYGANREFIYLFDENRALLFYYPNASAYVKMTGLVEQIVIDDHGNDYSEEIFKSQITFTPDSLPVFSNHNQTKEEAYPSPTVSFQLFDGSELIIFPTHDRLTMFDPNCEQYPAGRIKGTVKLQGTPVAKKVMCFTQYGQIVAETYSDKFGNFEFTELRHDKKYMITAQAGHEPNEPPEYHPDTVGYMTPEVYKL